MSKSIVEKLICDREFSYLEPYFYNNPYALRCELGIGADDEYIKNAKQRAVEIYNLLFPGGADAIILNYRIEDYSRSGEAEESFDDDCGISYRRFVESYITKEAEKLSFLLEYQGKYRHIVLRDLEDYKYNDGEELETEHRNRIICYSDGKGFDYDRIIDRQIADKGYDISFVSFKNECIFSIYDERGCDVVFTTQEKFKQFYHVLKPYFLEYDAEEMEKRFNG